jgi:hypothetical protein
MGLGRDLGERAGSDCDSRREWSFPPRFAASLKGFSAGSRRSRRGWPSLSARTPPCGLKNADLKRRLGLDSSTSSKPPSSDGLRKKEAKPARTVRQGERGTARPQGRYAQAGRRSGPDRHSRGARLPPLRRRPEAFDGAGDGDAPGLRPAGEADRGHRASATRLRLRRLRRAHGGGLSRRRRGAGAIWRASRARRSHSICSS